MSEIRTLGPVGLNPTGEYDETHEYERLDVVYYEGSSYVALQDSIGQLPTNTEYWDCIAVGYLKQNTYDSVAEMKADDTLKNGMYAQTVGYYEANDSGAENYLIRNKKSSDVDDGDLIIILNNELVAEKIIDDKVEYIFPKFWANAYSGDSNLIKYLNKTILIDCQGSANYSNLIQMLEDNNVEHIDYFILTHYHGDHFDNFYDLVENNIIDKNTKLYMPAEVTNFGLAQTIADVKELCEEKEIIYYVPEEYEELKINNLKFIFFNTDAEILDDLYTDYNDCSTQLLIIHKNVKLLYTGDGDQYAFKRMREENFVKSSIDFLKIGHHGINQWTDVDFVKAINPTYAVQTSGISDFAKNNLSICQQTSLLRELGTKIYPTHMQNDYIKFVSDGSDINCLQGKPYNLSYENESKTIYVDINSSKNYIQDGTQEHPFSEIMQAIGIIESHPTKSMTIHLADGTYCMSHEQESRKNELRTLLGRDVKVVIEGNSSDRTAVKIRTAFIENSNIKFKNVSFDVDTNNGIYVVNSNIILDNVLIDSFTNTLSTTNSGLIIRDNSRCIITNNTKINNCNEGIIVSDSDLFIDSLEYGTINSNKLINNRSNIVTNSISFRNNTDKFNFNEWFSIVKDSHVIFNGDSSQASLNYNINNYDWVEIEYQETDAPKIKNSTGRIYSPAKDTYISAMIAHPSGSNNYSKYGIIRFTANNSVEINNQHQVTIYNGSLSVEIKECIHITKITAGYKDYQLKV